MDSYQRATRNQTENEGVWWKTVHKEAHHWGEKKLQKAVKLTEISNGGGCTMPGPYLLPRSLVKTAV